MNSQKIKKEISGLPDSPGVYLFKKGKSILYVGKATSLKDRVRSYFNTNVLISRSPLVSKMLSEFDQIDFVKTDSVLEALVLEANLIKKYQPEANIKEKDNRSFNFVIITDEDFPKVLVKRGRELEMEENGSSLKIGYKFGPFPNGSQLKEAMKILRKLFPFRDKCEPNTGKSCFNRQIGLCPGVCSGEISKEDYQKTIENIKLFFESDKSKLIKNLEKQMKYFAHKKQFEKAGEIKKTLFTLNHIQDVSLVKVDEKEKNINNFRIEGYDIAHTSGKNMVGVMVVLENGELKKSDYRKFIIKENHGPDDTKALAEIISRRIAHIEWPLPDLFVIDGGKAQKNIAEKILKSLNIKTSVVSVVKDERHKPKEILGDKKYLKMEKEILLVNNESHRYAIAFHKKLRGKI